MNLDWPPTMLSGVKQASCDFFDKVGYQHSHPLWLVERARRIVAELRRR